MSSESESKGGFRWWASLLGFLMLLPAAAAAGALLVVSLISSDGWAAAAGSASRGGTEGEPQAHVLLSRAVYNELLAALGRHATGRPLELASIGLAPTAAVGTLEAPPEADAETLARGRVAPAPPAREAAASAGPAVSAGLAPGEFRPGSDARFSRKVEELRRSLGYRHYPSFEELYALVVNKPYDPARNIWRTFPNAYNLTPSFRFPFSNLREAHVERALTQLGRPPAFIVEVGSFHGHSAVLQARVLDKLGFGNTPLLCIDSWTGDLGMLLYRDDWDKKLVPGELSEGRSTSYWQFMLNVKSQIDARQIGPKHIVPLAVTSVVGARYLAALGLTPDLVFLDSAHEADETFAELSLYFRALAPGGVLLGDDFSWESVRADVLRFAAGRGLEVTNDGVVWSMQKASS